jgi:hypothetical protein
MPDSFGVYDDMKVWEYLDFFARCYGIPADRRRRMIGDLLELVDLGSKRDVYVQGLSRGMQQRLCLAHTLVHARCALLDEPASGLNPQARIKLRELLRGFERWARRSDLQPHPPRAQGCARACDHRPRPGLAAGRSPTSNDGCARAPSCGSACWPMAGLRAGRDWFAGQPDVTSADVGRTARSRSSASGRR